MEDKRTGHKKADRIFQSAAKNQKLSNCRGEKDSPGGRRISKDKKGGQHGKVKYDAENNGAGRIAVFFCNQAKEHIPAEKDCQNENDDVNGKEMRPYDAAVCVKEGGDNKNDGGE